MNVFIVLSFVLGQINVGGGMCHRLDTNRSAQYISFVRWGPDPIPYGKKHTSSAWLRIHNNTSCPILLIDGESHDPVGDDPTYRFKNGSVAQVYYESYDSLRFPYGAPEPTYGDVVMQSALGPGDAVEFRVPISHFAAGRGLAVPFAYLWDNGISDYFARHHIYMVPEDLPKEIRGRFRRF